jgi:isopentenyl-diphosphate delta-isomerase
MDDDEILDAVDRNDNVIGQKKRSELRKEDSNFRAINVFLLNMKGQIWIPRRAAHKKAFPLCLDMSCGGYVMSGESYEDALKREVKEELALDVEHLPCRQLGYLTPYNDEVSMFMKVYEIRSEQTPNWNPNDFVEACWLWPEEILKRVQEGERVKDDLPRLIEKFYTKGAG